MKEKQLLTPPLPKDKDDLYRWEHTRKARRLLYGVWKEDLERTLFQQIGRVRREAWGTLDLSANLFRTVWDSIAVLYDRAPIVSHEDSAADILIERGGALDTSGLWSLMARVQRDVLGLREMFLRVDVAEDGELVFRAVPPDMIIATPRDDKPDVPVRIEESRLRENPFTGESEWTWDIYDVSNPAEPVYVVLDAEQKEDLTWVYLGEELSGEAYPYRKQDGTPILPFVLYHAANTGCLFDPYSNKELIEGTLNVGAMYTYLGHIIRSASWPQRYAVGVELPVDLLDDNGDGIGPQATITDPSTVVMFRAAEENMSPQLGQWSSSADPQQIIETITQYERRLMTFAGLNSADLQRMSGDPRSGYAVSVSREAQREVQRRFEPQFRKGDLELIGLCAILLNRKIDGLNLPESGYRIRYQSLPRSPEEERAEREHVLALMNAGLMDRVTAYQRLNEGITREEAEEAVARIQSETVSIGG